MSLDVQPCLIVRIGHFWGWLPLYVSLTDDGVSWQLDVRSATAFPSAALAQAFMKQNDLCPRQYQVVRSPFAF